MGLFGGSIRCPRNRGLYFGSPEDDPEQALFIKAPHVRPNRLGFADNREMPGISGDELMKGRIRVDVVDHDRAPRP